MNQTNHCSSQVLVLLKLSLETHKSDMYQVLQTQKILCTERNNGVGQEPTFLNFNGKTYSSILMGRPCEMYSLQRLFRKCAAHVHGLTLWLDFRVFSWPSRHGAQETQLIISQAKVCPTSAPCSNINVCRLYISTNGKALASEGVTGWSSLAAVSFKWHN